MTRLEALQSGRLGDPVPMTSLPFAQTIDLSDAGSDPDEPSPCLPTARSVWYALRPPSAGRLVVDLAGSTPLDPLVRLYRQIGLHPAASIFLGCASPLRSPDGRGPRRAYGGNPRSPGGSDSPIANAMR